MYAIQVTVFVGQTMLYTIETTNSDKYKILYCTVLHRMKGLYIEEWVSGQRFGYWL